MVKKTFFFIFFIAHSLLLFSTAQDPDILLWKGKKYDLHTNPLEVFLKNNPGKRPRPEVRSTANWRGYIATFKVKGDRLLLADVEIMARKKDAGEDQLGVEYHSVLAEMFPGQKEVFCDWFRGHIIIPSGKLVQYVHMGYGSVYNKYILLRIENGVLTKSWTANQKKFKQFRAAQFAAFKKTEEYRAEFAKLMERGGPPEEAESFLFEYYSERYMSMVFEEKS